MDDAQNGVPGLTQPPTPHDAFSSQDRLTAPLHESAYAQAQPTDPQPASNESLAKLNPGQSDQSWQHSASFVEGTPSEKSAIDNMPVVRDWRPAPGFSALGVLAGAFVWIMLAVLVGPLVAWIIQTVVLAVYAIVFYRSYFTDSPRISSSKAISFLNYAVSFSSNFVSVIIGWCWNRNLRTSHETKTPKMGISYIVAIVYFCLMIGLMFWYENTPHLVHNPDGSYTYVNQPSGQNTSNATASQSGTSNGSQNNGSYQASIPSTNTQVTVPVGWDSQTYGQGNESPYEALLLYPSYAGKDTAVFAMAWDTSEFVTDEFVKQYGDNLSIRTVNEDVVLERNRMNMDTVDNETASLVEINGVDYWKAVTEGTYSGSPMKDTSYYCYANSSLYQYTLSCLGDSDISNETLAADFDSIVASADYK